MVLGPINQAATHYSSVPNPKKVWEYERPLKEEEVTNTASHSGDFVGEKRSLTSAITWLFLNLIIIESKCTQAHAF